MGHDEVVSCLCRDGDDVKAKDHMGETPLYKALSHVNIAVVKALLNTYIGDRGGKWSGDYI